MEPTTAWAIAKTAGEISKKLYEFGKGLKDREAKHQIDLIADQLRELKHSASQLEDENRDLRDKLRFKTAEYEFRTPFWYHNGDPELPLCPKCFANGIAAAMGQTSWDGTQEWRRCLVCDKAISLRDRKQSPPIITTDSGMPR